jgi:branched-chain amino acid transport system permease protein
LFAEVLVYGTVQGAILALLALGFSLVYGVGGILNLSHGAFYLITCYAIYWCIPYFGLSISVVIGLVVIAVIGVVTYIALIKPLQKTPMGVILVTFALAFFFEQYVRVAGDPKYHYIPPLVPGVVEFLGVKFLAQFLVLIIGSAILITIVVLFIKRTRLGKSIRAVAQDSEAAKLMGINTDRVLMIVFLISALLAGFAAVFYAPGNFIAPHIGWGYLVSAFAVTIFGGMGSITGSILGAFIMGYVTTYTQYSPFLGPAYAELVPIIVIVVMLLVRPQGLLGKKEVH